MKTHPTLSTPEPLRGIDGGFTHQSVSERLPNILSKIIQYNTENHLSDEIIKQIQRLKQEIENNEPISSFEIKGNAYDRQIWMDAMNEYIDGKKRWLEIPWFFAEVYLYRKISEICNYFKDKKDPFAPQKKQSLDAALNSEAIVSLTKRVDIFCNTGESDDLLWLFYADLWGNKADLSFLPSSANQLHHAHDKKHGSHKDEHLENILVDDAESIVSYLLSSTEQDKDKHIIIVLDNCGMELVSDLCFIEALLNRKIANTATLYCKPHPLFVSDATEIDVQYTIDRMCNTRVTSNIATQLQQRIEKDELKIKSDYFWTSPLPGWGIPDKLFEGSHMVILKGDANYRRMLGDLHWNISQPISDICSPFLPKTPVIALRTLKSETGAGIPNDKIKQATEKRQDWMSCGEFAVLQQLN